MGQTFLSVIEWLSEGHSCPSEAIRRDAADSVMHPSPRGVTNFPGTAFDWLTLVARASSLKFSHIFGTLCCDVTGRRPVVYEKGVGMEAALDVSLAVEGESSFGQKHFGAAQLGDKRLTDRAVITADALMRHPGGTLPDKLDKNELLAFYDFANNPKVCLLYTSPSPRDS